MVMVIDNSYAVRNLSHKCYVTSYLLLNLSQRLKV